jgi:hypothetical protein
LLFLQRYILDMKKSLTLILTFALVVSTTFASLSSLSSVGTVEETSKANKYSLKSLHSYSKKSFSLTSYKSNLQLKSNFLMGSNTNSTTSNLQFDNGNTSYTIPFKYTVKVSKFKTPTKSNL